MELFKLKIRDFLLVVIIIAITIIYTLYYNVYNLPYLTLLTLNTSIVSVGMFCNSKKGPTIFKLINFFIYIFFILANAIQFGKNTNVLTFSYNIETEDYLFFQFTLLIILIILFLSYIYGYSKIGQVNVETDKNPIYLGRLIWISLLSTFIVLVYYKFNYYQLLTRGLTQEMLAEAGITVEANKSIALDLIFSKVIRSIPWGCFMVGVIRNIRKKYLIVLFLLMLLTVFPAGLSRNAAAMYWLPVVLVMFGKYLKNSRFILFMLIALLIFFPFFDNFRHFDGTIKFKLSLDYLATMNMDASQIFMVIMRENHITWGNQLLGAIFFFVPRSLWPLKPLGSGHYFVTYMNGWFTNVSMPLFAEGFINFGYVGIIIFTILLGYYSAFADRKAEYFNTSNLKLPIYYLILGATVYILRGDLMSSFAYTIGIIISYLILLFILRINLKKYII